MNPNDPQYGCGSCQLCVKSDLLYPGSLIKFLNYQIPKLCPINHSTDLEVFHEKFDMPSPSNPIGCSDLLRVDLFVSTTDLKKGPPLVITNTIFSVPFCRKHDIEPRNPDTYFNLKADPTKNKSRSHFVKDRRRIKREYD
ncbi:hypothetical protein DITRI_Ditri08aG0081700 [Diplodiscus trichospermus]